MRVALSWGAAYGARQTVVLTLCYQGPRLCSRKDASSGSWIPAWVRGWKCDLSGPMSKAMSNSLVHWIMRNGHWGRVSGAQSFQ